MIAASQLAEVSERLRASSSFVVVSHYNPDPDAYGSSAALALVLQRLGKSVTLLNESGIIDCYSCIPGVAACTNTTPEAEVDTVVICDCGDLKRVGDSLLPWLQKQKFTINIDHHVSNDSFGTLNLVDEHASSTSEVIFKLLEEGGFKIDSDVALALYCGILADSGSFRHSCTTEDTFAVAQRLVHLGVDPHQAATMIYSNNSLASVRLQAEALAALKLHAGNRVCELLVTEELARRCQAKPEDTEGLVDKGRDIEGVILSFLIRWDVEAKLWKVSMRSKSDAIDLSQVAAGFGGGGHRAAAAFRFRGPLEELRDRLLSELAKLI